MHTILFTAILLVSTSSFAEAIHLSYPGFDARSIGSAIDIDSGEIVGKCMAGNIERINNKQISHDLSFSQESASLHHKVHGTLDGSLSLGGLFGVGSSVELTRELKADSKNLTVVFNVLYRKGSVFLENPTKLEGADCGEYYVSGYSHGAVLVAGIKIAFKSKEKMTRFKQTITSRGLFGLFKSSRTEVKEARKSLEDSTIVSRISLEGASDDDIVALGNRSACQPKDLEKCLQPISRLLELVGQSGGFVSAVQRYEDAGREFVHSIYLSKVES